MLLLSACDKDASTAQIEIPELPSSAPPIGAEPPSTEEPATEATAPILNQSSAESSVQLDFSVAPSHQVATSSSFSVDNVVESSQSVVLSSKQYIASVSIQLIYRSE